MAKKTAYVPGGDIGWRRLEDAGDEKVCVGDLNLGTGGVGQSNRTGGSAGNGDDGGSTDCIRLADSCGGGGGLGAGNNSAAGQQSERRNRVGFGRAQVGVILHQIDTGAVQIEG